jgi:hypothetical protein
MNATILDLRYKMNMVLGALENRESVQVLYHGKVKGVIIPVGVPTATASAHDFFGSDKSDTDVNSVMAELRGGRHRDL